MSTMDDVEVTTRHLDAAETLGEKVAQSHKDERGEPVTEEELTEQYDPDDIVFRITGAKTHEVPESYLIIDSFEAGYFYWGGWDA